MTLAVAIAASLVAGAVAGFLLRRRSERWCTVCGAGLRCLPCTVNKGRQERVGAAPQPPGCR